MIQKSELDWVLDPVRCRAYLVKPEPMLDILCVTTGQRAPQGLEHVPWEYRYLTDSSPGWGQAANALLDQASAAGHDALFLDDDVILTADTFSALADYRDKAEMFGFDLHDLSEQRQVGARHVRNDAGAIEDWVRPGPAYVAHVSTSACYIAHRVLAAGVRFPIWPGLHWEDVAFCFDVWAHGFRVLAIPGRVDHDIAGGVGATKRHDPAFWARWHRNTAEFGAWCRARDLSRVPVGERWV